MVNYYEFLKVPATASTKEIEASLDAQLNTWLRQVTHHDPEIVDDANRNLRKLEQIRTTLTDPAKRADYDQSLNVGGLADPEASLRTAAPLPATPPTPSKPREQVSMTPTDRVDAWVCQKCQVPNAVGLQFCSKCGSQIGHSCPKCQKMIELAAPFCAYCGADLKAALEQKAQAQREKDGLRIKELQEQIHTNQTDIQELEGLKSKIFVFMWEPAWKRFGPSLGCQSRLVLATVFLGTMVMSSYFMLSFLDLIYDGSGSRGLLFVLFGLGLPLLLGSVASGWPIALFLKPLFNNRIQVNLDKIAELEQTINEIKRSGLSNR